MQNQGAAFPRLYCLVCCDGKHAYEVFGKKKNQRTKEDVDEQTFKSIISLSFFSISTFSASSADGVSAAASSFFTSPSLEYHLAPNTLCRGENVSTRAVGRNRRDCERAARDGEERMAVRDWRRSVREIMMAIVIVIACLFG